MRGRYPAMMMEIVILLIVLTIGMAKHGRRRRSRWTSDMQKVQLFQVLALSTLAASTLIGADMIASGDDQYRILSMTGYWSLRGGTAGEGPLIMGVAHSGYSDAQIEAVLETETMLTRGNIVATREVGRRLVRRVGQFSGVGTEEVLNDGKVTKVRLNWAMGEASVPRMWVHNFSGATLAGGAIVSFNGSMIIKWL